MIRKIETYFCDGTPSDEDIQQAIDIVHRDGVFVKLTWFIRYSGNYSALVKDDSTIESVKERIPKVYGI